MVTADEEIQAKEFLKRAEIRTMKKDLQALRETDALKERDKIAIIKTLEEQLEEKKRADASITAKAEVEKIEREEILEKNEGQERIAEKDLKNYATEQERQQIFLLESQRLGFEKQVDTIDKEKDPALKLQKNEILLKMESAQTKLNAILEQEKKIEDEQKFTTDKEQTTTIDSQRKGLQQSRQDLEKKLEEIEKGRWAEEKQIQDITAEITQVDKSTDSLVTEKNSLRDKILGIDKSLREIYSVVMLREEEKRRGEAADQIAKKEAAAKIRASENEKVQRQQWSPSTSSGQAGKSNIDGKASFNNVPVPVKKRVARSFEAEEEQRKKFVQDVDTWAQKNESPMSKQVPIPPKK